MNKKRNYDNDYPSVTQVLDLLRKPALEMWFKKNTLEFINRESAKAKEIGTLLHQAIQDHIELNEVRVETAYTDEIMNCLKSFMLFKKECPQIKLIKAEIKLTSETYKFNGTTDCLGNDREEAILDWKSGKCGDDIKPPIYDDYIYQISAYVNLYNEVNKANIKKAYILALAKDQIAYNLKEIGQTEIEGNFNNVFLPLLKIWQYKKGAKNG